MASLFRDPAKLSAYRDRRFLGGQEEYEHALQSSTTVYVGNMSFYTTEEQIYELFSRAGEIKKINRTSGSTSGPSSSRYGKSWKD